MQQLISKVVILFLTLISLYFYFTIFQSSLRLEDLKKSLYAKSANYKGLHDDKFSSNYQNFIQTPSEIEIFLRFQLINGLNDMQAYDQLFDGYQSLLTIKPTWPYYYSGLAQIDRSMNVSVVNNLFKAIQYGAHEKKVINSIAEILFSHWEKIKKKDRNRILDYLSTRNDNVITSIVTISVKFAKIYVFCDYIYEKKHVEYAACKQQYWQPLSDL